MLREILEIAREHQLIVYSDEVYDKVLFDGRTHTAIASLAEDVLCLTFGGLSKNYRACGYRAGWMIVSGEKRHAQDYIEGLTILASMRLCSNVPGQYAIQTALGGYQSIDDLVAPGGRLTRQRDLAWQLLTAIPGVTCVKPQAALYLFPRLDPKLYPIADDEAFILELLESEHVLLVHGLGLQLAAARSLPRRLPSARGRPQGSDRPHRTLSRVLSEASRRRRLITLAPARSPGDRARSASREVTDVVQHLDGLDLEARISGDREAAGRRDSLATRSRPRFALGRGRR